MADSDQSTAVAGVAASAIRLLGLLVEDVTLTPAGKRRLVRISVDRDLADVAADDHTSSVAPLTLDEVAEATRTISDALDQAEPLGQLSYVLEVTSPGVQRALTHPRHYRRNVGRLLELTLADGTACTGRLVAAAPHELTVVGSDLSRRGVATADITRARVQVEFGHADPDEEN